jgi:flagellar biogenesis protein FliO
MVPTEKSPSPRGALPSWLIFCLLGLAATVCGLVLPHSVRSLREPTAVVPAPTPTEDKKDSLEYTSPMLPDLPPAGPMLLRLFLGTVFVLLLCTATLWAGKRWIRPLSVPAGENRKLRVLESLPLGGRCSVYLLQAEQAKILVGVDQTGIKALAPLPQPFEGALAAEMTDKDGEEELLIAD